MRYIPQQLECFLVQSRSPGVWRPFRLQQQQHNHCTISSAQNPWTQVRWGCSSYRQWANIFLAHTWGRLIGNGNNWWNHIPHHIPQQKWLFTKELAELCVTLTYIRVGRQVRAFTHSHTPHIHTQWRLYAMKLTLLFGRQPHQLMKWWQHETWT